MKNLSLSLVESAKARLAELDAERAMLDQLIRHYEGDDVANVRAENTASMATMSASIDVATSAEQTFPITPRKRRRARRLNQNRLQLLHVINDGGDRGVSLSDLYDYAENAAMGLTTDQVRGAAHTFKKQGLAANPRYGVFAITESGRKTCKDNPNKSAAPQEEAAPSIHGSNGSVNGHDANGLP